jgi:anti-sigma factor RsiW
MTRDELEFSLSQYLDGTLPPAERVALEARLAADAEARAVLAEYRQLDEGLKSIPAADPLPGVHWDRFADQISHAVAAQDDADAERQAATYRIGAGSRRWRSWLGGLAVAASVLVAAVVGWRMMKPDGAKQVAQTPILIHDDQGVAPTAAPIQIAVRDAEPVEPVNAQPVVVAIGPAEPSAEPGDAFGAPRYAGVVSRPSRLTIASALSPVQDAAAAAPI